MGVRSMAVVSQKETMLQANRQLRKGMYCVWMRVPRDIRRLYDNKKEVKYSRGTSEAADTRRALGLEFARIQKAVDDFRVNPIELEKLRARDFKDVPDTQLELIANSSVGIILMANGSAHRAL